MPAGKAEINANKIVKKMQFVFGIAVTAGVTLVRNLRIVVEPSKLVTLHALKNVGN